MAKIVLDASCLMAVFLKEVGAEVVLEHARQSIISAVNIAEIVHVSLRKSSMNENRIRDNLDSLGMRIHPFDVHLAYETAKIKMAGTHLGISLGDAACLALARQMDLPVLTGDRAWMELDIGVHVRMIR